MIDHIEHRLYTKILNIVSNGDNPLRTTFTRIFAIEEIERMRKRIDEIEALWN